MPPRRAPTSSTNANTLLTPQDQAVTPPAASLGFPSRSTSPSSGFTNFLSKPSKWFTRSASNPKISSVAASSEPRSSSSSGRKHKISRPTDPRPILDSYAARSVMDLTSRNPSSLDLSSIPFNTSQPSSPLRSAGLGDLRAISRKGWSRSADDLGKFPTPTVGMDDKIAQYRNRSNSNASSLFSGGGHPSATPIAQQNFGPAPSVQPFPLLAKTDSTAPTSASNPIPTPAVSISISAPAVDESAPTSSKSSPSPAHVHIRSHSFTPKLASKLSAPRLIPPSPKRKGSAGSEMEKLSPSSIRSAFPFSSSSKTLLPDSSSAPTISMSQPIYRSTTLLAPPAIAEPITELSDSGSNSPTKRSSQIVYNSGFINKFADGTNANLHQMNFGTNKSWKPYKLELKGSKLYFYKPPSDRAAAVKELFPTELVPANEQDDDDEKAGDEGGGVEGEDNDPFAASSSTHIRSPRQDSSLAQRKKRAFWGRRTHPDLAQDADGNIEKGTFEALTHEAVFGTTFFATRITDGDEVADIKNHVQIQTKSIERWKDFASSILLCLPHFVDQSKFEAELIRCCEYLVTGAEDDDKKTAEKQRVSWLVSAYLGFHRRQLEFPDWPEWAQLSPNIHSSEPEASTILQSGLSSTQALQNPTHVASPHTGTFSPRPGDSNALSLFDALGGRETVSTPQSGSLSSYFDLNTPDSHRPTATFGTPFSSSSNGNTISWAAALDREGLSRDVLLLLDPNTISRSLTAFHLSILHKLPEQLTADFVLKPEGSDSQPHSSSSSSQPSLSATSFAPLFGSDDHPHWLTKLLLVQILGADTSTGYATLKSSQMGATMSSPSRRSEDRTATSRTHSRSEVITAWIKIGERCRLNGDECSWRAIICAICSAPIARLEKAWKRVEPSAVAIVESWVQVVNQDGETANQKPRITPWGGNMISLISEQLAKASAPGPNGSDVWILAGLDRVRALFDGFRTAVSLCLRNDNLSAENKGNDGEVQKLVAYWKDIVADGGVAGGLAVKFQRVEQFISLSLAAEPRRKGLYEPFYWAKAHAQASSTAPLLPLLFPEPLPSLAILDRSQFLRGRVDSDTTDIQHLRAVDGHLRPEDRKAFKPLPGADGAFAALHQGGTTIPVYNGDLLLVVQNFDSSSTGSRPSSLVRSRPPSFDIDASFLDPKPDKPVSRTPSIRVKPGSSTNLERKSSVARRSSLPSLSQRQPLTLPENNSTDPPLRVLVQAGTLDRLVEVLIHGLQNVSVSVADDNGEMSLRAGMTRELLLDHKEFSIVWWNVFRSFVTPLIFFELLRKIYIKSQPAGTPPLPDQYIAAITSKSQVLETIKLWLTRGGGAQDVLDDSQLLQALRAFFNSSNDHIIHSSAATFGDSSVRQAWDSLTESRQALESLLRDSTMRPSFTSRSSAVSRNTVTTSESRVRNLSTREPPDMDRLSPEEFVDNIDGMAFAAFNNVTEEDLYITSDLLEVQSADRTGWFLPREGPPLDEHVEIQTIHSYILEVEPSSLISELSPEALYRLLPPGIRSCFRAHTILRRWIISKVVAPRLGFRARQARLEFLLQAIEVARLRNAESSSPSSVSEQPCVRSFVEAVVTSAILSPECRMHQRAWQNIAANRGCQYETLAQLLVRPNTKSVASKDPLTVDMGWLIERILDVIAMPDLVESHNEEGQNLVNFDKRRNLCNFISNAPSLLSRRLAHQNDINRRGFERLNNIEREIVSVQFDLRGIKDEAYRESTAANVTGTPSRKVARPFQKLVAAQMEKYRRDKHLRARLQKEKMHEQSRNEKREEQLNKAMRGGRRPNSIAQKQHRNKKSMSALFSFMRPISSAFGADTSHAPLLRRTASELDFVPSGKPTLVLNLTDSNVAQFINNDRSFTFQLDTEDGGHYLLQAMSKREMNKWIETLCRISKSAAKRRLTYLGNSPKPQVSDHIHEHSTTATKDPTAVFGVELNFLLDRENGGGPIPPGTIPSVIEACLAQVEARGLTEVGIYRMAGASSEIAHLKEVFNRGENPLVDSTDIHAICDLIKSWFRVLPDPLFPPSLYHEAIDTMKLDNLDERLTNIRKIVHNLPRANFDLLKLISEHLDKVTDFEEFNQMTAEALSIVFSPNLLRAPQNDFLMVLANMPHTHRLVKTLITHYHVIFDDTDAEAEVDPEDDLDAPLTEADEEDDAEGEFTSYIPTSPDLESGPTNTFRPS